MARTRNGSNFVLSFHRLLSEKCKITADKTEVSFATFEINKGRGTQQMSRFSEPWIRGICNYNGSARSVIYGSCLIAIW